MEEVSGNKTKEISKFSGKAMSEEELAAYEKSFQEIEESIELVMKNGEDL